MPDHLIWEPYFPSVPSSERDTRTSRNRATHINILHGVLWECDAFLRGFDGAVCIDNCPFVSSFPHDTATARGLRSEGVDASQRRSETWRAAHAQVGVEIRGDRKIRRGVRTQ